jgi:nitrogenase molybdenum-iron protein alpha/beta subunit
MNSNPLRSNTSRFEGCTVTGALAVSAFVSDAVSIVHGPPGCAHHNISLLHYTMLQHDELAFPDILSSGLLENDIIFGGEEALEETIGHAAEKSPGAIFVISTCIADTIGDDVAAVCAKNWGIPVIFLRSSGFLGGTFNEGYSNALIGASRLVPPAGRHDGGVNLVGEKNLEYEVEENFNEISRILELLDLPVHVRFVRNTSTADLAEFSSGCLNVIREDTDHQLRDFFTERFGIPSIGGFPTGLQGTLDFIEEAARRCGIDPSGAISDESTIQEEIIEEFSDLRGERVMPGMLEPPGSGLPEAVLFRELAGALDLRIAPGGKELPVPWGSPVGTAGIRRMLHLWRRTLHA